MLKIALVVVAVVAVVTVTVTNGVSTVVNGTTPSDEAGGIRAVGCNASIGPWEAGGEEKGRYDASRLDDEQRGTVAKIISIGQERKLPPLAWQIAIQAGMTESGLRSLNYGDRDSLGIFQMRPSMGWGSPAQVTDPIYAINKFFDVLENVPDWQTRRPGDSAQAVERSAFPDRYHNWEAMAAFLIGDLGNVVDPAGCGAGVGDFLLASSAAATAIEFTKQQLGEPYLWGGNGPDQWDCSGILVKAFAAAGVKIPRVANDQYTSGGAHLPVREAKPGDLLFWATNPANPVTVHHVAMYLGGDEYIHAPQTGDVVKISKVNWDYHELMPLAVRPGV
ncbi:C40 family peptidase [Saccharothrix obliqua]|uniref:C40 family peptidase n=1 Tax=Saccharothrix obliqua TaxID=2861747 RepID=UPI001C5CD302|nr:C40 family peptidase [Saccharothrix obliqua]MBW4719368.1 C40 family peptidase [Saccharothrix obliqua]